MTEARMNKILCQKATLRRQLLTEEEKEKILHPGDETDHDDDHMPSKTYSDFREMASVLNEFGLDLTKEKDTLFADASPIQPSDVLRAIFERYATTVILDGDRAKAAGVIAPILTELQDFAKTHLLNMFPGHRMDINKTKGLWGECDYLITNCDYGIELTPPVVIAVVQIHDSDMEAALAQCIAVMVGAQKLNELDDYFGVVYGVVTSADQWSFLSLRDDIVNVDPTDTYPPVDTIFGILMAMVNDAIDSN